MDLVDAFNNDENMFCFLISTKCVFARCVNWAGRHADALSRFSGLVVSDLT